jgi:L-malate glycosyltransferase
VEFIAAVNLPEFRLSLVGDPITAETLQEQAAAKGISERLDLRGYRTDVASELSNFDILVYILNPQHYGTAENALLEAMAMGVVPVVLNNPAERCLIKNGKTGLIVSNPTEFASAIEWLATHPSERLRISQEASRMVRQRFSAERTRARLERHYRALLSETKHAFDFRSVFGNYPSDWFLSCQGESKGRFLDQNTGAGCDKGPYYLYEKTKGSVFHYRDIFPHDARLQDWAQKLALSE